MKAIKIYEQAMCCITGVCGAGDDPELLRVAAVTAELKKNGITVSRFNLSSTPAEFGKNKEVWAYLKANGERSLPVVTSDDKIIIKGRYPTNEEFIELLKLPKDALANLTPPAKISCGGCEQ